MNLMKIVLQYLNLIQCQQGPATSTESMEQSNPVPAPKASNNTNTSTVSDSSPTHHPCSVSSTLPIATSSYPH